MAYLSNAVDDEKRDELAQMRPGTQPTVSDRLVQPGPSSMSAQGDGSGRFVGFERYFNANRDAAKATGDKVAGSVESRGAQAQGGLNDARREYEGKAASGVVSFRGDESEDESRSISQQQYTGPNSLDDSKGFAQVAAMGARAQRESQALNTRGGRQEVLRQEMGQTTQGGGALDGALTQATSGGRFRQLRQRYGALGDTIEQANAAATQRADAMREASGAAAADAGARAEELRLAREGEAADAASAEQAQSEAQEAATATQARQDYAAYRQQGGSDYAASMMEEKYGPEWTKYVNDARQSGDWYEQTPG